MHVLDATSIACTGVYVNLMDRCSTSQQHHGPGPGCGCSVTEKENAKRTIYAAENYSAVGYGKKARLLYHRQPQLIYFVIIQPDCVETNFYAIH